jgi:sec-independent protein translocase protein TatB
MFDIGWGELLVIGAVALVAIPPKDLPKALRTLGSATAKLKRMAAEFQGQFNEALREAELDEIKKSFESVGDAVKDLDQGFNPINSVRDELKTSIEAAPEHGTPQAAVEGTPLPPALPDEPLAISGLELPPPADSPGAISEAAAGTGPVAADAHTTSADAREPEPSRRPASSETLPERGDATSSARSAKAATSKGDAGERDPA